MSLSLPCPSQYFLEKGVETQLLPRELHTVTPQCPTPVPLPPVQPEFWAAADRGSGPAEELGHPGGLRHFSPSPPAPSVGGSVCPGLHTWIVALPHLFGGRFIGVPRRGLIDGRLAPPDAGRESLGLIVCFGDAGGLGRSRAGG